MQNFINLVTKNRQYILDAEKYLWTIPEPGFKEYKTNDFMINEFEKLGYTVTRPENITGFSAQLDTGKKGPTIVVLAELDALYSKEHPATSVETGCVHACGHHIQLACALGVAKLVKEPEFIENLCGKIKFVIVPAEEGIEISYRQQLIKEGKLAFSSGKPEFVLRGFFNDADLCFMVHARDLSYISDKAIFSLEGVSNGVIRKTTEIYGKASHAGGNPHEGINALNAGAMVLSAINNLRETFEDNDHVRVHSIITQGGSSVNVVPDKVVIESYVRASSVAKLKDANEKVNRAITASCAVFGAKCKINDLAGSEPLQNDTNLKILASKVLDQTVGKEGYSFSDLPAGFSTDMGDITQLFPSLHAYSGGVTGTLHSKEFAISNYDDALIHNVNFQVSLLYALLENNAEEANKIISKFKPAFESIEKYLEYKKSINSVYDGVEYLPNGKIQLTFKK